LKSLFFKLKKTSGNIKRGKRNKRRAKGEKSGKEVSSKNVELF